VNGNITEKPHISRIATLLGEIEALSRDATEVSLPVLMQTRASLEKARSVLQHCGHGASDEEDEGDPQPDVDGDLLERMYHDLGAGRRPPER